MTFSQEAYQNRALRTIQAELEFLRDTSLITPATLAQVLQLLPTPSGPRTAPPGASPTPAPTHAQSSTPAMPHLARHFTPPMSPPASTATPLHEKAALGPAPPPSYTPMVRAEALWAFSGSESGDLTFAAGDTIEVVEKVKDDWWRGRVGGGEVGLFPSSYVREITTPNLPPRGGKSAEVAVGGGYGRGGNMMTDVAHDGGHQQQQGGEAAEKKPMLGKNGEKFGKKLGNAAIFGAGATIGGKIVNGIF
ncbi:hypothetical protein EDC01DRAFT_263990 [Geopyxis carbonaria]|nr:hypothetical protein EDC01DRAFT_263990 [Geopyxis carbonaria]